ncbi:MAG: heparan-alpha-glucosaminide N-acetyltransferase domain-containing protein, partial [Bosea sp. (in: a-proteobacteria)]
MSSNLSPAATETPAPAGSRWPVLDVARGVALVAMFIFHFMWDLSLFGL